MSALLDILATHLSVWFNSVTGPGGCTALSIASDRGHRGLVNLFRLRGVGLAREWYFNYDRCVESCSIPGCSNVAEGCGGVCHRYDELMFSGDDIS